MIGSLFEVARTEVRMSMRRPLNLATGIVAPLMFLCLLVLPRLANLDSRDATAVFTGVLLATLWTATLWSSASIIRRERAQGTLGAIATGRLGVGAVLLSKTLGTVLYDISLVLTTNTLFVLAVGLQIRVENGWAFAVGLIAVVFCGVAGGFLLNGVLVLTRFGTQLTTLANTPVLLVGGTIIPYQYLPDWIEYAGAVLNLFWLQKFLSSTASGDVDWAALIVAIALSLFALMLGVLALRILLSRARKAATLEIL